MGTEPWNADLLDYLAAHLADSGYDLKKSLALIATSQVYSMQTVPAEDAVSPEDYVFAGPMAKRMTAEQFTDALTRLTGVAADKTASDDAFVKPIATIGERPFVRASLVHSTPLMRTLGRPNREQVVTTRPAELTTLEAIALSNGQPLSELLEAGAKKLADSDNKSPEEICRSIVRSALSREPTDEEVTRLTELAGNPVTPEGLADALWCIVMLPEFQLIK
jgi:hypothetical protein